MPTGRLVGFTRTVIVPGSLPLSGLAVTHSVLDGLMAVVKVGVPLLAFTETVCAAGRVDEPAWYVKLRLGGVAVTVTVCACAAQARPAQRRSILLTTCLSVWQAQV